MEIHNTSDSTVEFLHGQEMAYFDARSKGLVQINNLKCFPIDQYFHDRMTPATLSPLPLANGKLIHPTEMPHITTCTEMSANDTNKSTPDNKYPWLDPDDIRRNMTDKEILKYRRIKVKYPHHKVLSRGLRYQYQADLVDYSTLKRDNHSFTFLLTIIDIFSRFPLAIPIKSKKGPYVATALERAFKVMKPPRKLQTNMGTEFYRFHIKRVLDRYRVNHFSTDQPLKAQIVECF